MALILDDKARENLDAAERLLQDDVGQECLPNALANRAYYAAYLAAAHVAQHRGLSFTSDRNYYRHDSLPDLVVRNGLLDQRAAAAMRWLYGLRVKADYTDDAVAFDEANQAFEQARRLVGRLLP
jgi:uncharacterized protein (UPF0332 family)